MCNTLHLERSRVTWRGREFKADEHNRQVIYVWQPYASVVPVPPQPLSYSKLCIASSLRQLMEIESWRERVFNLSISVVSCPVVWRWRGPTTWPSWALGAGRCEAARATYLASLLQLAGLPRRKEWETHYLNTFTWLCVCWHICGEARHPELWGGT